MDELAASIGRVIPLASAYGVEMDQLSTGYAELTKGGIATAEATTYLKGMFTELGDTSSQVATTLMEETGSSFSQLMASGMSLGDVMRLLGDSVNGDATAFANLWSSQEAGVGALALYNAGAEQFNGTLEEMRSSAGATADAYDILNNTLADAMEDLENSTSNLTIAVGDALSPAVEELVGFLAEAVGALADWAAENPGIVAGITAFIGVVAAAVIGVTAYTGIAKIATAVTATLGGAFKTAFWPITLVAGAIAGVVVACQAWAEASEQADEGIRTLTPTCQTQLQAIHDMEDELQSLEDAGQGASEQAAQLRGEIEAQRAAFEGTRTTMEDYMAGMEQMAQDMSDWKTSVDEQLQSLAQADTSGAAYVDTLQRMAKQSGNSASANAVLEAAYARLQEMYPGMTVSLEEFVSNTDQAGDAIKRQIDSINEQASAAATMDLLTEASKEQMEAEMALAEASEQYEEALRRLNKEKAKAPKDQSAAEIKRLTQNVEDCDAALESAKAAYADASDGLRSVQDAAAQCAQSQAELNDSMTDQEQAFAMAGGLLDQYEDQLMAVAESQQECVESARQSLDSQFGMFEAFKNEASVSLSQVADNMRANTESMAGYRQNLEFLQSQTAESLGVSQEAFSGILAVAAQGTPEAMAYAQEMVSAIQNGNEEAVAEQAKLAEAMSNEKERLAEIMGEMQNETKQKLADITQDIETEAHNWDASETARTSATNMMNALANAIQNNGRNAVTAAQNIASQIRSALSSAANVSVPTVGNTGRTSFQIYGHARGTLSAPEDVFIAGEEGPELIVGAKGSRVFPANETSDILDAIERIAPLPKTADTTTLANIIEPAEDGMPILSLARVTDELHESVEALNEPGRLTRLVRAVSAAKERYTERRATGESGLTELGNSIRDALDEFRASDPATAAPPEAPDTVTDRISRADLDAWWQAQSDAEWYNQTGAPTFETLFRTAQAAANGAHDAGEGLTDIIQASWKAPMEIMPELPSLPDTTRLDKVPMVPSRDSVDDMPPVPDPPRRQAGAAQDDTRRSESTLHIDFGDGKLVVPKSLSLDDVHAMIMEQAGPALMRCLKQEAVEEGDGTYVF